jgi:hypothetical protein
MLSDVVLATGLVVTVKVVVVVLAATVTLAGACAALVLLLDNVTTAPPDGAGPFNVTVPVDVLPPKTDIGLRLTDDTEATVTVKPVLCVEPYVAERLRVVLLATGAVVTVNGAVVAFAGTVTLAGACAALVLLLDKETMAPPVGAGAVKVTVPVDVLPPITEEGFTVMDATVGKETKLSPVMFALLTVVL